jgi:hypothetical protein
VTNLARMYAEGLGTPQDISKAIRLFEGVADFEIRAQFVLSRTTEYCRAENEFRSFTLGRGLADRPTTMDLT